MGLGRISDHFYWLANTGYRHYPAGYLVVLSFIIDNKIIFNHRQKISFVKILVNKPVTFHAYSNMDEYTDRQTDPNCISMKKYI